MREIEVITKDDTLWMIPEKDLGWALKKGAEVVGLGEKIKVKDSDGKVWDIKSSNLAKAYEMGGSLAEPELMDRAKEFGQGVAQGLGTIPDAANKLVGAGVAHLGGYAAEGASALAGAVGMNDAAQTLEGWGETAHQQGQEYSNSHIGKDLASADILQTSTLPDDTSSVLKSAGEFATDVLPYSLASKGVSLLAKSGAAVASPWLTKLDKWMKIEPNLTTAASFAGMGAGKELAHSNDPEIGELEQVSREIVGMIAGGVVAGPLAAGPLKGIYEIVSHPIETLKKIPNPKDMVYSGLGKIFRGNKINEAAIEGAEKLGIQLTPKDLSNSSAAAFIQNNILKSTFTSEVYNEVMEKAPLKLIENIGETFEKIGPEIVGVEEGSAVSTGMEEYKKLLETNKEEWNKESTNLYNMAKAVATQKDPLLIASKTKDKVNTLIEDLNFGISELGGDKGVVLNKLNQLKEGLNNPANIRDLIQEKIDLTKMAGEAPGYKELFKGVAATLEEDIASYTGNAEFSKMWKIATEFNKEMIQTRIKTDISRSILSSTYPAETLKYMNDAASVKHLEKIIGTDLKGEIGQKANLIMNKLKRGRTEQFFKEHNIIKSDGNFNATQFLNIFERNKNEDFLKSIMGTNYNTIKTNISPIATIMEQSIKKLSNSSNSAIMGKDIGIMGMAATGVMTGNPVLLGNATAVATSINILSRIFADPKFAQKIIQGGRTVEQASKKTWDDIIRELGEMSSTKYSIGYEAINNQKEKKTK